MVHSSWAHLFPHSAIAEEDFNGQYRIGGSSIHQWSATVAIKFIQGGIRTLNLVCVFILCRYIQ